VNRLALSHLEYREGYRGPHYYFAVFDEFWPGICRYPDCGKNGAHAHRKETGDLTAAELLALDENAFNAAFEDLRHWDAEVYSDISTARLELLRERDEDEERATADCGRRVA
jgi:hypothetical protein